MLITKQLACPTQTTLHLVEDKEDVPLIAELPNLTDIVHLGGVDPAFSLNGLQHDGTGVVIDGLIQGFNIIDGNTYKLGRQWAVILLMLLLAGGRQRRQRSAVEGLFKGNDFKLFGLSLFPEIEACKLYGALIGFGAAVGKEHLIGAGIFHNQLGQLSLGLNIVVIGAVYKFLCLFNNGINQCRVGMAQGTDGNPRNEIGINLSLGIPEFHALSFDKANWQSVSKGIHIVFLIQRNNLIQCHGNHLRFS